MERDVNHYYSIIQGDWKDIYSENEEEKFQRQHAAAWVSLNLLEIESRIKAKDIDGTYDGVGDKHFEFCCEGDSNSNLKYVYRIKQWGEGYPKIYIPGTEEIIITIYNTKLVRDDIVKIEPIFISRDNQTETVIETGEYDFGFNGHGPNPGMLTYKGEWDDANIIGFHLILASGDNFAPEETEIVIEKIECDRDVLRELINS